MTHQRIPPFFRRPVQPCAGWTIRLAASLTLAAGLLRAGEPGTLDPGFTPPENQRGPHRSLVVAGRQLYLLKDGIPWTTRRLEEDGTPDPAWRPKAPLEFGPGSMVPIPSGGWLATDSLRTYWELPDGSFAQVPGDALQWFPQEDGSLLSLRSSQRANRRDWEGRDVQNYGANARIVSVSFVNPSGRSSIDSGSATAVADSRGRLIVGGNFISDGDFERPGLIRLLADGRPDPDWKPGGALGIGLTNTADPEILAIVTTPPTNFLTAMPVALTLGSNDSVVVTIEHVAPRGSYDLRVAVISERGDIVSVFPDESWNDRALRCVQPDGRILIASSALETWKGVPVGPLIRVEPDGTLDTSFQVALEPPGSSVSAMTLDDQGRLWISGTFTAVNGVARPGLARLFAYDPSPLALQMEATATRSRIAVGETLYLAARVAGNPSVAFQWYRNDLPISGASFRGLRLPVTPETLPAEFKLMAWNSLETNVLSFGRIEAAIRSPRPGTEAPQFGVRLTDVYPITHLLPLADGRILFGTGIGEREPKPLVGRLTAEGTLDPTFGSGGLVNGIGRVEDLLARPDGSVLVVGTFTSLAGEAASGIAELSSTGLRVERNFPSLDFPSVTTLLPLPDGQWILAGRFTRVSGVPKFRLARLKSDFSLDPSFDASATFEPWQVVDVLALDLQGRLLAGGGGLASEGPLTNPPPYGMVRLLADGARDPGFTRVLTTVRSIFVESDGNLVAGRPFGGGLARAIG